MPRRAAGEAAFVLRSAAIGPIEVRLRLGPGAVRAAVVVEPGLAALARERAPELAGALQRAGCRPAAVRVAERPPDRPMRRAGKLDAYA